MPESSKTRLGSSVRQLLHRAAGARVAPEPEPGVPGAATGARAAAVVESLIADAAGTGGGVPADRAAAAFAAEAARGDTNLLGRPLEAVDGSRGARTALSAAVGLAASSLRGTAFLSGPDLEANLDLLADAVARRLPLVVHLATRGDTRGAGSGHRAWHAAATTGAVQLFATDVQHAADLTLVARRVAEEALTPVLVAMDVETATGVQDLALPTAGLVRRYLGAPRDVVHSAGATQELLLGRHRRRLPRWHDLARPMAGGALLPPRAALPAAAARRAYLDPQVAASLERALAELSAATGRPLAPLTAWHTDGARVVLVVQGAAVETVRAAVEATAGGPLSELLGGRKVGVVGLTALRPLPAELAETLRGADLAVVLERADAPLDGDGPLSLEVAAALHQLTERHRPRLHTVVYGLGGFPLRSADLTTLLERLHRRPPKGGETPAPRYLGVDLDPAGDPWPKRQVVLDALRRDHPEARHLGLAGRDPAPDLRPEGARTLAVHRRGTGTGDATLTTELAALLHRLAGGHLRGRAGLSVAGWGEERTDLLTWAPEPLADPGADPPVEIVVWTPTAEPPTLAALRPLAAGGAVVFEHPAGGWRRPLPEAVIRHAEDKQIRWFAVPASGGEDDPPFLHRERQLGASLGVLAAVGPLTVKPRKLQEARRALLADRGVDAATAERRATALQAGFDRVHEAQLDDLSAAAPAARQAAAAPPEVPVAVRDAGAREPGQATVDSLARFWDQVVGPRRLGEGETVLPDPHLATGTLPARSAALDTTAPVRDLLPAFHPDLCTGCGACWTACPDGAVAPVAVGAQALLEHGMGRVSAAGGSAEPLRMALRKLAGGLEKELRTASGDTAALLEAAYDRSVAKMPLPEERKATVRDAFEAVRDELAAIPLTRTDAFGDVPFALALDPDACKGCGLCIAECEPAALTAEADSPQRSRDARHLWNLAAALPAPEEATLEAAREGNDALAAALMPAAHRAVLTGADGAEAGDGGSLAARQALAVASGHLAPRRAELLATLDERADELAGAIQSALSRALPGRDLEALAAGLDTLDRSEAELTDLIGRVEAAFDSDRVDVPRLRHLVDAARELADLKWRLTKAETGRGRSLFSVVVGPGPEAAWSAAWPVNPWSVPVTVAAVGDAAAQARGVLTGQLRQATVVAVALRRAALELDAVERKRTGGPAAEARLEEEVATLRTLTWRDLEPEERALCPPLFLLASEEALLESSLPGLAALLRDELPVKVLLLTGRAGTELPLTVPTLHAQSTVAHGDQLAAATAAALEHDGPALVRVLAPSPTEGGFAPDATLERCRRAVDAGEWELFVRRPGEAAQDAEPATVASEELDALRRRHDEELARLRADYEHRLATQRAEIRGELAQQVRGKLLALALRRRNGGDPPAADPSPETTP